MFDLDLVPLRNPMLRQHLGHQAAMTFSRLCLRTEERNSSFKCRRVYLFYHLPLRH
jgi:hypothetical protein